MTTLTNERLEEIAGWYASGITAVIPTRECTEMAQRLLAAEAQLAELQKQEPVAWQWFYLKQWHVTNDEERARDVAWGNVEVFPLFTASPLPVVPDDLLTAVEEVIRISDRKHEAWDRAKAAISSYRAAMLQPATSSLPAMTSEHRRVIEMLLKVCGCAFEVMDDGCQMEVDGEPSVVVPYESAHALSDALDEIENSLPTEDDDRPDVFLAWSAMPRAALKSLLQLSGNSEQVSKPDALPAVSLTEDDITRIMQNTWNEYCDDTGCCPDDFRVDQGTGYLEFDTGVWANLVAARIISKLVNSPVIPESWRLDALSSAIRDVIAERQRQISAEGWTPEHDDEHQDGELARAAACYAMIAARERILSDGEYAASQKKLPFTWPWEPAWWKPTNPRRDLVKAGALILAEIERISRAAPQHKGE